MLKPLCESARLTVKRLLATIFALMLVAGGYTHTQGASEQDEPLIYFGFIPRYNPLVMYRTYQPIMDYLSANTPYRFELKLSRDYPDALRMLREGETQIASLGDLTFIQAFRAFGAVPILKPLNAEGLPLYRSSIVVRADSPIRSLDDLRGASFAFGNYHSTSGNLVPHYYFYQQSFSPEEFSRWDNLSSHDAVAKAVLKGQYDAGALKDVVAHHYLSHGLRILADSDPIPSVPIVVRQDTSPTLITAVKQALLTIDPADPFLKSWDTEFSHGFVLADEDDYDIILHMMDNTDPGCARQCH